MNSHIVDYFLMLKIDKELSILKHKDLKQFL